MINVKKVKFYIPDPDAGKPGVSKDSRILLSGTIIGEYIGIKTLCIDHSFALPEYLRIPITYFLIETNDTLELYHVEGRNIAEVSQS